MGNPFAIAWIQSQGRALMILFHGTTKSRADRIQKFGFERPDFDSEIAAVCRRYEVRSETLREQLTNLGRIISSRNDDSRIYFSSHFMHAASYATRAPEFYWEALWAIYVIRHPELGFEWNQSDEGQAWVLSQMQSDAPVVLHVEVPDEILGHDAERIVNILKLMPSNSESGGVEVGLNPSSDLRVVDQTTIDYWIDGSLLRFLTDLSQEEIGQQVSEGLWGQPFSYQSTKYWMWANVKALLKPERLHDLNLL